MFKKRRLFRAVGFLNVFLAIGAVSVALLVVWGAPWQSPYFALAVAAGYTWYYWAYAAKKTNVYYGASWAAAVTIRDKILRPLPGPSASEEEASFGPVPTAAARTGPYSDFISRTLRSIPTLRGRGYKPTFYLESPSVQTVYATALRADPQTLYDREVVTHLYADGEACVLDWSFSSVANDGWSDPAGRSGGAEGDAAPAFGPPAPVVVLFHGLTGGSDDCNMHYTTRILNANGFHVVIPVRRGCADAANLISRNKHYPYGDESDTALAVEYIARKMRGHWLMGIGLSAGSNVLSIYLGTQGSRSRLRAGIAVANGYCWNVGTRAIVEGSAFWSTLMSSMVQYNLLRRHDTDVFFNTQQQQLKSSSATASSSACSEGGHNEVNSSKKRSVGVVESHDLDSIRRTTAAAKQKQTSAANDCGNAAPPAAAHPFVQSLVDSSAAARRLVARTVTHTQLAATYLLMGAGGDAEDDADGVGSGELLGDEGGGRANNFMFGADTADAVADGDNKGGSDASDGDSSNASDDAVGESQTTTPFPYPFDRDNFLQPASNRNNDSGTNPPPKKKKRATVTAGGSRHHPTAAAKVISTLYGDYSAAAEDPNRRRLRTATTTDASALMLAASTPTTATASAAFPLTAPLLSPHGPSSSGTARWDDSAAGKKNKKMNSNSVSITPTATTNAPRTTAAANSAHGDGVEADAAFEKAVRSGLRGRLNKELEEEAARLADVAAAGAATFALAHALPADACSSHPYVSRAALRSRANAAMSAALSDAVPVEAVAAHLDEAVRSRYRRSGHAVVLKEHYAHIRDYDECVSRRLHGYSDLRSFYDAQSCRHVLGGITVPTFFLNALDDPVASPFAVPYRELAANPNTCLVTTPRGGHLGWADGLWPFPTSYHSWLERFIREVALAVRAEVEAGRL